jgi:hypothetical protein
MNTLDLLNSDIYTNIKAFINGTVITGYGIVETVLEGRVNVLSVFSKAGGVTRLSCKYLGLSSSALSVSVVPAAGDLVLLISLPHKVDAMFTAEEPIEITEESGYNVLNCVAIPLGAFKADATTKVEVTDSLAKITAPAIEINGNDKTFTMKEALDTALQSMVGKINTELGKLAAGATAAVAAGGHWTTPYTVVPITVDISAAASTTLKSGG